jgi:hypothetical protein
MPKKVFFSFHHKLDHWRVNVVRNSWLTKGKESTFIDAAEWEKVKRNGDAAVKKWIDRELEGTSVTVVLIGEQTSERKYVRYELEQSYLRGNGILAVYIHGIKNQKQEESSKGGNPLRNVSVTVTRSFFGLWDYDSEETLADLFETHYWLDDNGRENLPTWIEHAFAKRCEPPLNRRRI